MKHLIFKSSPDDSYVLPRLRNPVFYLIYDLFHSVRILESKAFNIKQILNIRKYLCIKNSPRKLEFLATVHLIVPFYSSKFS